MAELKNRDHILWPAVDTLETARRACVRGAWTATFLSAASAIVALLAASGVEILARFEVGPEVLIYSAFLFCAAWGMFRCSRTAAAAGLALYMVAWIAQLVALGTTTSAGVVISLAIVLFLLGAVRGAFAHHRHRKVAKRSATGRSS